MCVDFRELNKRTVTDHHLLPRMQATLESLGGNSCFSRLEQGKAYHQGYIEPSQHLTASTTPWGLYDWVCIPLGLKNAPGEYQRFMKQYLGELRDNICILYLDDVICFSKTFEDHLDHLHKVFQKLREHGVKLEPSKCKLSKCEVSCLGRIFSADGFPEVRGFPFRPNSDRRRLSARKGTIYTFKEFVYYQSMTTSMASLAYLDN